jgi:kynurenine formamidase
MDMPRTVDPDEVGRVGQLGPQDVLAALGAVTAGRVFDLDAGRFVGMPLWEGHPDFLLTSYRTPQGSRRDGDIGLLDAERNADDLRFNTELMVTGMHTGTHLDALNHVACGLDGDRFYGGYGPADVGDFGPQRADAASIPPIIVRATVLDLPALHGVDRLPPGSPVTVADLRRAEAAQAPVPHGGAVLLRTGLMTTWPDRQAFAAASGAGIDAESARWLAEERGVVLAGSDTPTVEQVPSTVPTNPHPVHDLFLRRLGIHLLENLWLEDVAAAGVHQVTLVCLPLKVAGATASMVRPIALV